MAEFRDLPLNQDSVYVRDNDIVVPHDFPNELSLGVIRNLDENMLDHMNDGSLPEEINRGSTNERDSDAVVPHDFPNELSLDVIHNLELDENMLDHMNDRGIREEENLLILSFELKDDTLCLLELELILLDIKHKKFKQEINSIVAGLNNIINKFRIFSCDPEVDDNHNQLQGRLDSLTMKNKELEALASHNPVFKDGEDKFLDESQMHFLKYQKSYKKCLFQLENFLEKAEKKNISNIPRESQEELCVLFSVLEENLGNFKKTLISSKDEFEKFNFIIKKDIELSYRDLEDRINLFIAAIKKAELAYIILKPILFDIIHFQCAIRGHF